ncbi:MAG: hypothetical protein ACI32E_04065 [Bacilli bacterium]
MKKNLKLIKDNDNYAIKNEEVSIEIIDKKIDAQSIYDKIYSILPIEDNEVEIVITTDLKEKEDQIIFKQIKNMFEKIDKAINQQLNGKN